MDKYGQKAAVLALDWISLAGIGLRMCLTALAETIMPCLRGGCTDLALAPQAGTQNSPGLEQWRLPSGPRYMYDLLYHVVVPTQRIPYRTIVHCHTSQIIQAVLYIIRQLSGRIYPP